MAVKEEFTNYKPGDTEWRSELYRAFDKIMIKLNSATSKYGTIVDNVTRTNINKTLLSAIDRIKEDYFREWNKETKDKLYDRLMLILVEYKDFLAQESKDKALHDHVFALMAILTRDMYPER